MATNITPESVLDKISKDRLECPICMKCYMQPKLLDCLHSFCQNCLQELRDRQDKENRKLTCPVCRHETILTEKEVAALPNDIKLSAMVEEVNMQKKLLQGQGSEIKCQACDDRNQAISRCMDCDHFLCQECQRAHERMAVMKSHQIYTLAQLRSGEIIYKSKLRDFTPKCETHTDQNLSLYCNTCEKLICLMCSVLVHVNRKHCLVDLSEALDKCKQDIAQLVAKVKKSKTELSNALSATERSCKKLDSMFADTIKKICRKADKEVTRIREAQWKLKQKAEKIYKDRVKTFEIALSKNSKLVTQAENKVVEVNRLMDQGSHCEILALQQKLFRNLKEFTVIQPEKVSDRLCFMDFKEGERSLGRLVLESNIELKAAAEESPRSGSMCLKEKWALKTDINRFGSKQTEFSGVYDVAAFSNNEIIVADIEHKLLITFSPVSKPQSIVIPQRLQIKGLNAPSHVTVNKDDQLIVLDGTVMIFNNKYQLLNEFTPGRGSDSEPTCLAVDDNNLIAVGYQDKEEISLHNPEGTFIRTLPAPGIGDYLTICKQRFIYTDYMSNKLLSVDYNGVMVFSVDITSDRMPSWDATGVCCDRDGFIYVAVRQWPPDRSGDIQRFSPNGKYIECVIKDCSPPWGITFTPGGDLVVTTVESVQIYHQVQKQKLNTCSKSHTQTT